MDLEATAQRTLRSSIPCAGIGLHGGARVAMTLRPAEINTGITFVRTDMPAGRRIVPGTWDRIVDTTLGTRLANESGTAVGTVEHLMAAFRACGIDNALVELDAPELPIMDGSATPFVFLIECAGTVPQAAARRVIRVLRTVDLVEGSGRVGLAPGPGASVAFEIDFASPAIGRQRRRIGLSGAAIKAHLAPARTFGFVADLEALRDRGLARGACLDNAVAIGPDDRVLNKDGLRFPDEFVRHKMLDAVGDLYLAGAPIVGHFHGHRSGHGLNARLLRLLFADERAWCYDAAADEPTPPAWPDEPLADTA